MIAVALSAIALVGCSNEPATHVVTGVVTFGGQALPYGTVRFYKDGGSPVATSVVDSSGAYSVEAVAGSHRVTVVATPRFESDPNALAFEGGVVPGAKATGPNVPGQYGDVGETPFRCDVQPGDPITFDIEIPAPNRRR